MERSLPTVLFVGPSKTGSTWVHEYLKSRGDVILPRDKESYFFSQYFDRGIDWYAANFSARNTSATCIEVCTNYAWYPVAADRIAATLPGVRVIFTLRNPVDRALSHYWHLRRFAGLDAPIECFLRDDSLLVRASKYDTQMERYTLALGTDRIGYLIYDDLKKDAASYAAALCQEIGLPFQPPREDLLRRRVNQGADARSIVVARLARGVRRFLYRRDLRWAIHTARAVGLARINRRRIVTEDVIPNIDVVRRRLYDILADDIGALERRLGRSFPDWHKDGADCSG